MSSRMRDRSFRFAPARAWRIALAVAGVGLAAPLFPQPSAVGAAVAIETPSAALARNLRLIAENPRNFDALVAAGRAALGLGDFQAAVGFFGRAEEVRPSDPAPKIGMGAASVQMGDNGAALQFFAQAQQLGASPAAIGADRGLVHDLNGNHATAQADYRAALLGPDRDEARRRLALSLGISGDRTSAFATLQPLLMRRDPAAQRVRAFVLALLGDRAGARSAIDAAMPGSAARIDPFFAMLPNLSSEQKAAAVHLGIFPTASEVKLAAVAPVRQAPRPVAATPVRQTPRLAAPPKRKVKPRKVTVGRRVVLPPQPIATPVTPATVPVIVAPPPEVASVDPSTAAPGFQLPSSTLASVGDPVAAPAFSASVTEPETPQAEPVDVPPAPVEPAGDRLTGIDKLLAEVAEAPPPSRPRVERAAAASDRPAADAKKAAERRERDAIGVAGTHWVQLAGGSHADRMGPEFRKLAAKSSALKKRGGLITQGKDYFRLLTGPFPTRQDAQSFVNTLAKDGVDGFSWTRTPATIKIEKLPAS